MFEGCCMSSTLNYTWSNIADSVRLQRFPKSLSLLPSWIFVLHPSRHGCVCSGVHLAISVVSRLLDHLLGHYICCASISSCEVPLTITLGICACVSSGHLLYEVMYEWIISFSHQVSVLSAFFFCTMECLAYDSFTVNIYRDQDSREKRGRNKTEIWRKGKKEAMEREGEKEKRNKPHEAFI